MNIWRATTLEKEGIISLGYFLIESLYLPSEIKFATPARPEPVGQKRFHLWDDPMPNLHFFSYIAERVYSP